MRSMIAAGIAQAMREGRFLVWLFGVVIVAGLFVLQPLQRLYDEHLRPVPWITAAMEILPAVDAAEGLLIRYDVRADIPVRGTWTAWLQYDGRQICFRGAYPGSYGPATPRNRIWLLSDWLSPSPCTAPTVPFQACVKYEVSTDRGASGGFGPFCSPIYDPREVSE